MTLEESAREALAEGKAILADMISQFRETWRTSKGTNPPPSHPPALDAEGWRKKYESMANEASELRLQVGRHKADEEIRRENAQLGRENARLSAENGQLCADKDALALKLKAARKAKRKRAERK
jgi:hypothetical protein